LPEHASALLRRLRCDLIDDDEIDPRWIQTLADEPSAARVRDEVRALRDGAAPRIRELA
jgi:hypothetical protein